MVDDPGAAQAQALLNVLYECVAVASNKLDSAEERNRRAASRGVSRRDPSVGELRRELAEARKLIASLHRQYPQTMDQGTPVAV